MGSVQCALTTDYRIEFFRSAGWSLLQTMGYTTQTFNPSNLSSYLYVEEDERKSESDGLDRGR